MIPHLEDVVLALKGWETTRATPRAAQAYFDQGSYFVLTREAYDAWNERYQTLDCPEAFFIHLYLGLVHTPQKRQAQLMIYGIDSDSDAQSIEEHSGPFIPTLHAFPYLKGVLANPHFAPHANVPGNVEPVEALQRSIQWMLHKEAWFDQQKPDTVVQLLGLPFDDLQRLFEQNGASSVLCLPALHEQSTGAYQMDLILWGYDPERGIIGSAPENLIRPVPPYPPCSSGAVFNLLAYAL